MRARSLALLAGGVLVVMGGAGPRPPSAVFVERPHSSVSALALVLPAGSSSDPEGASGTAAVLGAALEIQLLQALPPRAELIDVSVDHAELGIRVVTEPGALAEATVAVWQAVMVDGPSQENLQMGLLAVSARARFAEAAPVEHFRSLRFRELFGEDHPWARPTLGTPDSREALTAQAVRAFWDSQVREADPWIGFVGPEAPAGLELRIPGLRVTLPGASVRQRSGARILPTASERPGPHRSEAEAEITSTWIALARRLSSTLEGAAAEVYRSRVEETLVTGRSDTELLASDIRLLELPDGPYLMVELAVRPQVAADWVATAERATEGGVPAPEAAAYFHWQRRRVRNRLLNSDAAPEDLALRAARASASGRSFLTTQQMLEFLGSLGPDLGHPDGGFVGPALIFMYGPRALAREVP